MAKSKSQAKDNYENKNYTFLHFSSQIQLIPIVFYDSSCSPNTTTNFEIVKNDYFENDNHNRQTRLAKKVEEVCKDNIWNLLSDMVNS